MVDLELAGDYRSALTYFAALGLAAICEQAGYDGVRLMWTDAGRPNVVVQVSGANSSEIGAAVAAHAQRANGEDSWLFTTTGLGARADLPVFSPRITAATLRQDWDEHSAARGTFLDHAVQHREWLDLAMIAGIGQPAHWAWSAKDKQPDRGASRWEMKTRNRGEEFVAHRLRKLAGVVAQRDVDSIMASLTGLHCLDDLDRSPGSRTSTGFTPPGPCDSVLAWCALWGISSFPTVANPVIGDQPPKVAVSPGLYPRGTTHPTLAVLPVRPSSTSPARIRSMLLTPQFDLVARAQARSGTVTPAELSVAQSWLTARGFDVLLVFRVHKSGSSSAPERQIMPGHFVTLL